MLKYSCRKERSSLRVIAGSLRGRRLKAPKGLNTRPTTDRIKESIFSMIHGFIPESIVLDLFSGTGNLGIESLSRGAAKAYFVDKSKESIQIIKENIAETGLQDKSMAILSDAFKVLNRLSEEGIKFDIIFLDPPYLKDLIMPCIHTILREKLLNDNGIIVIEHDSKDILPEKIDSISIYKQKKYGNTTISIYTEEDV
ncbi:MAG: 16S rRNA (guanine(966)-N(2))-methyltransferase RsmD [Bacillota bacterium]